MRTDPNIRAAIALLERASETFPFSPLVRAALAGEAAALRYVLREELPGPGTLEELLAKYAKIFDDMDAEALTPTGVTS